MRYCLVTSQSNWGGGETLLLSISRELEQAGHTIAWIVRGDCEVAERIKQTGTDVAYESRGRGTNVSDLLAIKSVLDNWRPDVLLMNDSHAVVLAGIAARLTRRPAPLCLAYKHTVFPLRSKRKYRWLADRLICVSEAARSTVISGGLPREFTEVIYGGCCPPVVQPDAHRAIRQQLKLKPEELMLLAVGNLMEVKGHAELIEAVHLLNPTRPIRVFIAGKGERHAALQSQIDRYQLNGQIELLGFRSDVNALLLAADLVVHPSHAEGLPLVIIESLMLGKPLIATPVGGVPELLSTDPGKQGLCDAGALDIGNAWLVRPDNVPSLLEGLQLALAELPDLSVSRLEAIEQARLRTVDTFSSARHAARLTEFASQLVSDGY